MDQKAKPEIDQENKLVKKKAKPNHFEQLLGGAGRPAKNAVAGGARSKGNSGKRMGKGSARGR